MIKCAINNEPIEIYGSHDALRNYIYVDNLYQILEYTINYCVDTDVDVIDKRNYTITEAAQIIVDSLGSSSKISFVADKADIPDNPFYDEKDIYTKCGIKFIDFKEAMREIGPCFKKA